jgi:hypothetical protein
MTGTVPCLNRGRLSARAHQATPGQRGSTYCSVPAATRACSRRGLVTQREPKRSVSADRDRRIGAADARAPWQSAAVCRCSGSARLSTSPGTLSSRHGRCRERPGGAIALSGPRTGGRRRDIRDERVRDRRVAADGIRRHREVSPLPGDALLTRSGVDARPAVSGSDLLRQGGAAAGSWKAGNCRARLAQREKASAGSPLGSVHAESG